MHALRHRRTLLNNEIAIDRKILLILTRTKAIEIKIK